MLTIRFPPTREDPAPATPPPGMRSLPLDPQRSRRSTQLSVGRSAAYTGRPRIRGWEPAMGATAWTRRSLGRLIGTGFFTAAVRPLFAGNTVRRHPSAGEQ